MPKEKNKGNIDKVFCGEWRYVLPGMEGFSYFYAVIIDGNERWCSDGYYERTL